MLGGPLGLAVDITKMTVEAISGELPVSDATSVVSSQATGSAVDGIAEGVKPNSSGNKYVKVGKFAVEQLSGLVFGGMSESTDKMVNEKLDERKDEE